MAEVTAADLKSGSALYHSSRGLFDVLVDEDKAFPLIKACSEEDLETLRNMLSKSPFTEIALESSHCIYKEERPRDDQNDVRRVSAKKMSNLERAVLIAAASGHVAAVSALPDFGSEHGVEPSSVIGRDTVKKTIENGQAAAFEALAAADPSIVTFELSHEGQSLDKAIIRRQPEVAEVLLLLGAGQGRHRSAGSFLTSRLSRATRGPHGTRMIEVLLQHGFPIAGSGALHSTASLGELDTMRLLIQHGANVNERLPEQALPLHFPKGDPPLLASWTPMHFAASFGEVDAMKLLESSGSQADAQDKNSKTPLQLLEERK